MLRVIFNYPSCCSSLIANEGAFADSVDQDQTKQNEKCDPGSKVYHCKYFMKSS